MAVSNLVTVSTTSTPTLQRTLTSGSSVSDLPTGKEITAFIIGGGGGGGASANSGTYNGGGGGGGSGTICQYVFTLPTSRTISYTIGAGGSGGTFNSTHGAAGGSTTFDGVTAFPGLGAGTSTPGHAAHGGGGGGAGGGNAAVAGGNGGAYGWKGQHRANTGSYGGYPGAGRGADLLVENGPFFGGLSQNSVGSTIIWAQSNPILPQYGDMIGIDMQLSNGASFYYTNIGYYQYGGSTTKITGFSSWNGSDLAVTMDYSTASPGGNNGVLLNRYTYPMWASPFSKLTRLDWLRAAGISIPGGGGGGGGSQGATSGGTGAGSGGNGGNGVAGGTPGAGNAGSTPGGGGGGAGASYASNGNNAGAGGAGAIYLFWAS
jgi:hypothetical protein